MKKLLLLSITLIFLLACNLPFLTDAETPGPTEAPQVIVVTATPAAPEPALTTEPPAEAPIIPEGTELNLGGVYMLIPDCLAVSATGEIAPAQLYDPMGGPMDVFPEHRRINFSGYPLGGTFFPPFIRVFPVAGFADAYAAAPENYAAWNITELQNLLLTRPADVEGSLPFLTMAGAGQAFHSKLAYLDFANGSGIRYLTSYGQYYVPYNNHDLFYTFQGITDDGEYWVSIIFPVNHAILPPASDSTDVPAGGLAIPSWDSPSYEADMTAYYAAMKTIMETTLDSTFVPGVDCLDQFVQSLNIGD